MRKRKTSCDYLVASREVSAWLSALSTVATNNSGFMFIGMIAYTYRLGVEAVWMMAGWVQGDLTAWFPIHPRVRGAAEKHNKNTLSEMRGTWSAMGASMGSVLLLRLYSLRLTTARALSMMAAGIVVVVAWHLSPYDDQDIFKILPGFAAAFFAYVIFRLKWLAFD